MLRPDFSGEYVLIRHASTPGSGAAAVESARLNIEHRDPVFRLRAEFVAGVNTFEYSFERTTDGREVASGENESSRLYWQGSVLVSEDRAGRPDSLRTISWRYELVDDGRRLRATEQVRGGEQLHINVWEFERA